MTPAETKRTSVDRTAVTCELRNPDRSPVGRFPNHPVALTALTLTLGLLTGCVEPSSSSLRTSDPYRLTEPRDYTAHRVSSDNPDPESNDDSFRPIPGETVVLADLQGPGVVKHLWMTIADNEYGWPRLLRLRVYYDGSRTPGVDAPVGDFFAVGNGMEGEVESLMVRNSSDGRARNCYWPMPFHKSCRITVTNEGRRRVTMLYYHVDWDRVPSLPADTLYFHARYRQALPAPPDGSLYEFLNVRGRGHYIGTVMSVVQAEAGWFGEGDDLFSVDGNPPSIKGTGSEDYFNDAWGLHVDDGPLYGVTVAEGTGLGSRMTAYRWHLPDPIPFTKSLRAEIEHRGWTFNEQGAVKSAFGERTDLISSVAFWYQEGIAEDQPPLPYGSARLPQGNATQIEVETSLADCVGEGGRVVLSPELFWSKDVVLLQAEGKDARLTVPFDVPAEGDYELYTEVAQASDYGVYTVLLDGQPPQGPQLEHEPGADVRPQTQFDGYAPETYVGLAHQVGWVHLTQGRHTLTYVCLGKREASSGYNLGVDDIVLARVGPEAWAAATELKEPRVPADNVAELGRILTSDPDPILRGLAAVALRDQTDRSREVLPDLITALKDPDLCVRMMSANALAALGPEAAPAVEALVATGSRAGEKVHVLRSVADALGNIGKPAAVPGLPLLRELRKIPRVQWSAESAIRKLETRVDLSPQFEEWDFPRWRQGSRPTCSTFTVTGALEFALAKREGHGTRLSVEFLNWAANESCGDSQDGGFFSDLWKGFAAHGICTAEALAYAAKFDPAATPPAEAIAQAKERLSAGLKLHWIKEWNVNTGLTEEHLSAIKETLAAGWPVCAGLRWPKQERWVEGVLQMCPPDAVRDGHSVLLIGYREDPAQPGGGMLTFRNTANGGKDGAMSYAYARAYMNDAAWID